MKYPAKRIIAGLDVKDGRVVKGVNFANLQDVGDPVENAALYAGDGADELYLLDITATIEKRQTFTDLIKRVKEVVSVPLSVSGGIRDIHDVSDVISAGADAVGIGTAAYRNPGLIKEASARFGSGKITLALDVKKQTTGRYTVVIEAGQTDTGDDALDFAKLCEANGAGAILMTSLDTDGAQSGYDIPLYKLFADELRIPVIASGGAGSAEHFLEVLRDTEAEAAFAASVFHFGLVQIPALKSYLSQNGIQVAK
ncbi:MAG: imidazole glycerol phosphate synthase cyclase subunit [Clostridiales bacterium]|nr:imidazole glycerol phosphate synthase cyclase subunit [Clostridiales bacterium]